MFDDLFVIFSEPFEDHLVTSPRGENSESFLDDLIFQLLSRFAAKFRCIVRVLDGLDLRDGLPDLVGNVLLDSALNAIEKLSRDQITRVRSDIWIWCS